MKELEWKLRKGGSKEIMGVSQNETVGDQGITGPGRGEGWWWDFRDGHLGWKMRRWGLEAGLLQLSLHLEESIQVRDLNAVIWWLVS